MSIAPCAPENSTARMFGPGVPRNRTVLAHQFAREIGSSRPSAPPSRHGSEIAQAAADAVQTPVVGAREDAQGPQRACGTSSSAGPPWITSVAAQFAVIYRVSEGASAAGSKVKVFGVRIGRRRCALDADAATGGPKRSMIKAELARDTVSGRSAIEAVEARLQELSALRGATRCSR